MGVPVSYSTTAQSTRHELPSTGAPSTDTLLRSISSLSPEQQLQFFHGFLGRMTNAAKEGVVECLWGSEAGEFDMPKLEELFNDEGIVSLFSDLDPTPSGRIATAETERRVDNARIVEQLRMDRSRLFGVRPLMITAGTPGDREAMYNSINI